MIIYDLSCMNDHRFEGWFRNADDFDSQLSNGLLACPECGVAQVRRIPSVASIASSTSASKYSAQKIAETAITNTAPPATQIKAMLKQAIHEAITTSEDVGNRFAAEARRIHNQEAPERSIRGQASIDQVSELLDEGIYVIPIPSISKDDLN